MCARVCMWKMLLKKMGWRIILKAAVYPGFFVYLHLDVVDGTMLGMTLQFVCYDVTTTNCK